MAFNGTGLLANYEALLEQVQYRSTAGDPTAGGADPQRIVTWAVNDGALSNAILPQTTITFNPSPVIADLAGDTSTFTEGGLAVLLDDSSAPALATTVTDN